MAPARTLWFRFYVETPSDPKIRRIPPAWRWLWTALLAAARKSPVPGVLLVTEGDPMTIADVADWAAMPEREVRKALDHFEAGSDPMLARSDEHGGAWVVPKFLARQFESDNSTDRTRKHRSKEQRWNVPSDTDGTDRELSQKSEVRSTDVRSTDVRSTDLPSSSSNLESVAAPPDDDEASPESKPDRSAVVAEALDLLARRDLERRQAEHGPVAVAEAWLIAARERRQREHGSKLEALDRTGQLARMDAEAVARFLDPQAAPQRHPADVVRPDCEDCGGSGWRDDDNGNALPCDHQRAQVAS